jgi:hypothetical protein
MAGVWLVYPVKIFAPFFVFQFLKAILRVYLVDIWLVEVAADNKVILVMFGDAPIENSRSIFTLWHMHLFQVVSIVSEPCFLIFVINCRPHVG